MQTIIFLLQKITEGTFGSYTKNVAERTRNKLQEIENKGIEILGCMIGLDSEEVETTSQKAYQTLAEVVQEKPTISPTPIPQTGENYIIPISFSIIGLIELISFIKYKKF